MNPFLKIAVLSVSTQLLLAGCAGRQPIKGREGAMRPTSAAKIIDDLSLDTLIEGIKNQISIHQQQAKAQGTLSFGDRKMKREAYAAAMQQFIDFLGTKPNKESLQTWVETRFDFNEVYGTEKWGEIFLTSYYEPVVSGSKVKTEKYSTPLLQSPADIIEVATKMFEERCPDITPMRGRLVPLGYPPGKLQLVPYFNREEIDGKGVLAKRGLELAYLTPLDSFFMQVQGSGTVVFSDGSRVRVGYAEQNGHRYESIGKFMNGLIPKEQMTLQTIERALSGMPLEQSRNILFKNPSYVFFKERDGEPVTFFGTRTTPGRTIASDSRYFPKGTLGFMEFDKPNWENATGDVPTKWDRVSRFVLDDDTGGAIRGTGRVDLFWGPGPEAKRNAGVIKGNAKLFYLVPKEEFLKTLTIL